MSFILDALKKADRRRPQNEVPDLHADHPGARPAAPHRSRLLWLIVGLVVVNLAAFGALYYYLAAPQEELRVLVDGPEAPPPVARSAESRTPVPARAPASATETAPAIPAPIMEPVSSAPPEPVRLQPEPGARITAEESEAPAAPQRTLEVPAADSRLRPEAAQPVILTLDELPAAVRAELPGFAFSMHAFTQNPEGRLVRINGRILREGQALREGLVLREVTPQGAVFAYREFLFEVGNL